jgi:predicted DNA-binding transcriptional regulator AlpA
MAPTLAANLAHAGLLDDRVVGTADAAAYLNYSVSHFRQLYRRKVVPPPIQMSGRKLGWRISTLKAYVAGAPARP